MRLFALIITLLAACATAAIPCRNFYLKAVTTTASNGLFATEDNTPDGDNVLGFGPKNAAVPFHLNKDRNLVARSGRRLYFGDQDVDASGASDYLFFDPPKVARRRYFPVTCRRFPKAGLRCIGFEGKSQFYVITSDDGDENVALGVPGSTPKLVLKPVCV